MYQLISSKKKLGNQRGNVLIVVLVLAAMIAVGAVTIMTRNQAGRKIQQQTNVSGIAEQIKAKLVGAVMSPQSWQIIQSRNPQAFEVPIMPPEYPNGPPGYPTTTQPVAGGPTTMKSLDIYLENSSTPYYAATNPRAGFNMQGNPCDPKQPFHAMDGNDLCPFRYDVYLLSRVFLNGSWIETVRFALQFRPKSLDLVLNTRSDRFTFNLVRNFDENNVRATCLSLNGEFDETTGACSVQLGQEVDCPSGKSYRGAGVEKCAYMKVTAKSCAVGQAVTGFDHKGNPVCAAIE